jgi:hypothetical protein
MIDWQARQKMFMLSQETVSKALNDIKSALRPDAATRARVGAAYGLIVQYISRQDETFFKELNERHAEDSLALKMIHFFAEDLKDIKVRLFIFEDKHLVNSLLKIEKRFTGDVLELFQVILTRFQTEQMKLFPLIA